MIVTITTTAFADEDSRWKWFYSNAYNSYYLDVNTIEYGCAYNAAMYWVKTETINGDTYLNKWCIAFDEKMREAVAWKDNDGQVHNYEKESMTLIPIRVESYDELEANAVCDQLKLPLIFGKKEHTWQWITSTGNRNYYICPEAIYRFGDSLYGFFVKDTTENQGVDGKTVDLYFVNFNKKEIVSYDTRKSIKVIPGTPEEAIFNAVEKIVYDY